MPKPETPGNSSLFSVVRAAIHASYNIAECGSHPEHLLAAEQAARAALPALLKIESAGNRLADSAERLEENPLANCLPRFRYPVVDAVDHWRRCVDDA